ncbi:MAG: DUF4837 family protein, partial [Gemmatimonadota bacterium]
AAAAALAVAGLLAVAAAACFKPGARGEANSLIVVHPDEELWAEVEEATYDVLEPTIFTVREEKKFYVQPVDTAAAGDFSELRTFRQVLIFGTPDNRFVEWVADEADVDDPRPGQILRASGIWAEGQIVTAVVLDPDDRAGSWREALPELGETIDGTYRDFVRRRMFTTGADSEAADSLEDRFGFRVRFPRVYDVTVRNEGEGPVAIRNDNPEPSQLIRSLLVDWRSPPLDSLTPGEAYRWRDAVDSLHYVVAQAIDTTRRNSVERLEVSGRPALEVTGVWSDEGTDFPAGGPFIARLVQCPERTYFLDAWLYAPGKDKYQYVLQLRELLDGFSCGSSP